MLMSILVAAAYFYFNGCYFRLAAAVLEYPRVRKLFAAGAFVLNYVLFYVCSILEWNLIINWGLFFISLFAETLVYCKGWWGTALFLSLDGILHGLTVNIFCRGVVSVVLAEPLAAFDNHIHSLKAVPVFLGFLLGGLVFQQMLRPKAINWLRTLIRHTAHLAFQLELMGGMFFYLFLNLLLYQSHGNSVLLKLWGIKSCIFSLVGSYLGLRYSLKMCSLSDYRKQNRALRQMLVQQAQQAQELRSTAYRDTLTGVYNRPFILAQLDSLLRQKAQFVLCFLDVDDLKGVNDRYGHSEGDRYLLRVAGEVQQACRSDRDLLARYGGDEFLLLVVDADSADVEKRIRQADRRLREMGSSITYPYPMSVSYGVVDGGLQDAQALISAADEKMYQRKLANRNKR